MTDANESTFILPEIAIEKTKRLVDLLKEKGITGGRLLENLGVEIFDNENILLAINRGTLFYYEYLYGRFKLFKEELLELKEKLNLKGIKLVENIFDGDISHLKDYFSLSVRYMQ